MRLSLAFACLGLAAACSIARRSPPRAEFLLSAGDSTFWISTRGDTTSVRGAPMLLVRYEGRIYELYTADDDFSYDDALLLGARLYRRDIASGDSAMLMADTTVPRLAASYARAHPGERPLEPHEDGEANPSTTATADLEVLDVHGPYVSYEYHVDVELPRQRPWHSTRRGVLDLRSGAPIAVADLFGASAAHRVDSTARHDYETARDSIFAARAMMNEAGRRAAEALSRLQFDARSFTLTSTSDGAPAVEFSVPGEGAGAAGDLIELDPVPTPPAAWWAGIRPTLPAVETASRDRWNAAGYDVIARYDSSGDTARVTLADPAHHEWPLLTVLAPLQRITFLDRPPIDSGQRTALLRAFNSAAAYDERTSIASAVHARPRLRFTTNASSQDCQREPARNVRAHDARTCQQHGSRVRRRNLVDDGQDGGDRGLSPQPRERRHGVDRSRRLSRADSPRRSRDHEGERQLRWPVVDGSGRAR
jgi:hypothetical protein